MINRKELAEICAARELSIRYSGVNGSLVWFTLKQQARMKFDDQAEVAWVGEPSHNSAVRVGTVSLYEQMEFTIEFQWEWFKGATVYELEQAVVCALELVNKITTSS